MQLTFNQIIIPPGYTVLLTNINWSAFEEILAELGEHRAARLSYSQGWLEIRVPLAEHESDKKIIGKAKHHTPYGMVHDASLMYPTRA